MLLKVGSKGDDVKKLQKFLGTYADGDFGKQTEKLVKQYQQKHGLVADGIVGDKTWNCMFPKYLNPGAIGVGVMYNPIDKHISSAPGRDIKYLVIHFTAGTSSSGDSETRTRNVFLNRNASADFVVDDDSILQVNPDPRNYFCWAVGGGKSKSEINNKDCVSIEMCSNLKKGTTAKVPNHEGWYFTEATIENTLDLCRMIMVTYNIPKERVIRHYDVTHKLCPGVLGWNPGPIYDAITGKVTSRKSTEEKWIEFKNRL